MTNDLEITEFVTLITSECDGIVLLSTSKCPVAYGIYGCIQSSVRNSLWHVSTSKCPVAYGIYGCVQSSVRNSLWHVSTSKCPVAYGIYGVSNHQLGTAYGM